MTHSFHRNIHQVLPMAVSGQGPYIVDSTGTRYLDASGGAAVSCLGHGDPDVKHAIAQQLDALAYAHTSFFTTQAHEDLADALIKEAPPTMARVYFTSGGSEAVETALKMARHYFVEIGQPKRHKFIARQQSYHGNTLGALSVGGNLKRREIYQPILLETSHISPCHAYRGQKDNETLDQYGLRCANELEEKIIELGPDTIAAFVAETVVGASLGAASAAPGYFKRIREICDQYGILLILDEVMCGAGRTGTYFACEQEDISPDIVTLAKGLAGGYQPIGATLVSETIFQAFAKGSGAFEHGHTYMGHPMAAAAALAVLNAVKERNLLDNVRTQGAALAQGLQDRLGDHPHVGHIRGRGLFQAIELVADRGTKAPFNAKLNLHARIKKHAMDLGLICYPGAGCADGTSGDHILLAPPFIIDENHVSEIIDLTTKALEISLAEIT